MDQKNLDERKTDDKKEAVLRAISSLKASRLCSIDRSLSSALECKQANQSEASASSDWSLTATRLCSIETHAIFSDFHHFQAGSVDFELAVVKRCVWGNFKSDVCYLERFEGDLHSSPFQNKMLKSVTLYSFPVEPLTV